MDQQQLARRSQEKAQIAACDPLTVIDQAKKAIYKGEPSQADPWLEEVVSRFEHQTKAALGSHAPTFAPVGGGE